MLPPAQEEFAFVLMPFEKKYATIYDPCLRTELSMTLDYVLEQIRKESPVSEEIEEEDREEQLEYLLHSISIDSRKAVEGLAVTVHGVNFYDDRTEVFLKIENETESEVSLYPTQCYAIRDKKQARCHYPIYINSTIPRGVVEEGSLNFEPIDPRKENVMFYFHFDRQVIIGIEVHID